MLEKLLLNLPPISEDRFTYFDMAKAFEVTINKVQADSSIPTHVHDVDVFNLILAGEIVVSTNGNDITYRKGEWFHLQGNQEHAVRTTSPVTLLEFWRK